MTAALGRALAKIAGREDAFVADCAGGRGRDPVCRDFRLSYEEHDALRAHLGARIAAWRRTGGAPVSGVERALPPSDRE